MSQQKVAVVTGSHRGLGLAIARKLALIPGMTVVLTSRDGADARTAAAAEKSLGLRAMPLDVSDDASVAAFADALARDLGRVDVLVNNAGINPGGPLQASLLTAPPASFIDAFNVNATGVVRTCAALVPLMKRNGYGRIVNVSTEMASLKSAAADYYPLSPAYRVSKSALNAVTVLLARELAGTNVLVNAYSPGWLKTDMGGPDAPFTADEGAETALHLATLPDHGPTGRFYAEMRRLGGPMDLPW